MPTAIVPFAQSDPCVVSPSQRGRKRNEWIWKDTVDMEGVGLRAAARQYIDERKMITSCPSNGRFEGCPTIIARCASCTSCSSATCFRVNKTSGKMLVETCGECSGGRNIKRLKLENAKTYGSIHSPAKARNMMASIPDEETPNEKAIANQRPSKARGAKATYSDVCLGQVQDFVKDPPAGVIVEHSEITKDCIRVLFRAEDSPAMAKSLALSSFLMDFTFSTNRRGLLLGSIGPAGMHILAGKQLPSMTFMPLYFLLADAEDEPAHRLCVRHYMDFCRENSIVPRDGYFDQACFLGAMAELESEEDVCLHRCLWHTTENVKDEAKTRDKTTGQPRLRNGELLPVILSFIMFSAFLPSDIEFTALWHHVFTRMAAKDSETDWNEPEMLSYLKSHIFHIADDGYIRAFWQSGLGCVPLGMTTYAPNAVERFHRSTKHLLPPGYEHGSVNDLMEQICTMISTKADRGESKRSSFERCRRRRQSRRARILPCLKVRQGAYDSMVDRYDKVFPCTHARPKSSKTSSRGGAQKDSIFTESAKQSNRLGMDDIVKHFRQHGEDGTFLRRRVQMDLDTGDRAVQVFVLPKYTLRLALDSRDDMEAALLLGAAETVHQVWAAAAHKERAGTGPNDVTALVVRVDR